MAERRHLSEAPPQSERFSELSMFDQVEPNRSSINIREKGSDKVINSYKIIGVAGWRNREKGIEQRKLMVSRGDEVSRAIIVVKDTGNGTIWIEDREGNRLPEFDGDLEVVTYSSKQYPKTEMMRSVDQLRIMMKHREVRKRTAVILDTDGNELCDLEYDGMTKDVIGVISRRYENVEQTAEKPGEHIYITDDQGEITDERSTRGEARAEKKRYLVVTSLIFHGNEILQQRRSADKSIDPNMMSSSAHGVAKEIHLDGHRVENLNTASIVNTALEINEELRHGKESEPFKCIVWPGTKDELFEFAKAEQIDDADSIYLVYESLYADGGYPLGDEDQKRTRALSTGFIFSKDKPNISYDPAEVSGVDWIKISKFVDDPGVTEDLQACLNDLVGSYIHTSAKRSAHRAVDNIGRDIPGK